MDVVAVAALDETFVYSMVIRFRESGLGGHMTSIAKLGLSLNEEVLRLFGVVRRVAVQAANIVARVRRRGEVPLLMLFTVTTQATGVGILLRHRREADDLGHVPAAFYVRGSGAVTGLTSVPVVERRFEMRCVFEVFLVQVLVTGLTSVNSDILGLRLLGWGATVFLRGRRGWSKQAEQQDRRRSQPQQWFTRFFGRHCRTPRFTTSAAVSHLAALNTATGQAWSMWIKAHPI
jgi:hypothetical protein